MLIHVGSDRQLLFDDFFFDTSENIKLTMHPPVPREVVLKRDKPWEGECLHYSCVLLDEGRYRMWYRADEGNNQWTCYAESIDGIRWEKPNLGLVSWHGSTDNNIVFPVGDYGGANPCVIRDPNAKNEAERYKMIVRLGRIDGYAGDDGLRWEYLTTILEEGPVDSHNILLWDDERSRYVVYARDMPEGYGRRRCIRRGESADFHNWSEFETVVTPDQKDPEDLNLYTNAAVKYFRAARTYLMFPMILYTDRQYPKAPHPGLSDVQLLTSRDGVHWSRNFREPFLTPGPDEDNWVDRNPIMGVGVVPTGPKELSMYYSERYRTPDTCFRRATLRIDSFVSVQGPYVGWGEFTTKPLVFKGSTLALNFSTSGGGGIQVEIRDQEGSPIPGYELTNCPIIFGDRIDGVVRWKDGEEVSSLAGQPVRLNVRLRDAHLYAFRFSP